VFLAHSILKGGDTAANLELPARRRSSPIVIGRIAAGNGRPTLAYMKGAAPMPQPVGGARWWGATERETRAPEDIFAHHAEALGAEDLDAILMDYADDACLITPSGVACGKEAIRRLFEALLRAIPNASWDVRTTFVDDLLFLEWIADSAKNLIPDGVDTFVFQDGLIRAQTARFTVVPKT
jgi:hypothetical protein